MKPDYPDIKLKQGQYKRTADTHLKRCNNAQQSIGQVNPAILEE